MTDRSKIVAVYALTALGASLWISAVLAAPYLWSRESGAAPFLYACFSPICHQIPKRSFHLFGRPMAVCARCFGIYLGFLAGLCVYPFARGFQAVRLPKTTTFLLLAAPIGFDTAGNFLGLWSTPNLVRFAGGVLWGAILPFYFLTGVSELVLFFSRRGGCRTPN